MAPIKRSCITELVCETVAAGSERCAECGGVAPGRKLFVFSTKLGYRLRQHDGLFCSKACHDVYHGLKPRR